jgi:hypothetical protein
MHRRGTDAQMRLLLQLGVLLCVVFLPAVSSAVLRQRVIHDWTFDLAHMTYGIEEVGPIRVTDEHGAMHYFSPGYTSVYWGGFRFDSPFPTAIATSAILCATFAFGVLVVVALTMRALRGVPDRQPPTLANRARIPLRMAGAYGFVCAACLIFPALIQLYGGTPVPDFTRTLWLIQMTFIACLCIAGRNVFRLCSSGPPSLSAATVPAGCTIVLLLIGNIAIIPGGWAH